MTMTEVQVTDFRSDPMPSHEGRGKARQMWDAYARGVNRVAMPVLAPAIGAVAKKVAARWVVDLIGFWVVWHLQGGFEGMQKLGYDESTIYRKIARFRKTFGAHPDEFKMVGVDIDPKKHWDHYSKHPWKKK